LKEKFTKSSKIDCCTVIIIQLENGSQDRDKERKEWFQILITKLKSNNKEQDDLDGSKRGNSKRHPMVLIRRTRDVINMIKNTENIDV
jgi:hypothetical protein